MDPDPKPTKPQTVRTFPTSDHAFEEHVRQIVGHAGDVSWSDPKVMATAEAELQRGYPKATIRSQSNLGRLGGDELSLYAFANVDRQDRRRRIVLIDDDPDFLAMVDRLLSEEGYDVRSASNAQIALEVVAEVVPDLILLDLQMPDGNGESFMTAYAGVPRPHARVIVVSGVPGSRRRAGAMGARGYIQKPFDFRPFLAVVRQFV